MDTVGVIIFWALVIGAIVQSIGACLFAYTLLRSARPLPPDVRWPKAAILLSLRGADPQLAESLNRLSSQDYPEFELHVVVDSVQDPAWEVVRAAAEKQPAIFRFSPLTDRKTTCGLQCSGLVQAVAGLSANAEVVVTIDGDLMPHPQWLQELVRPLLDDRVGASFGNRWFMPQHSNWGSLVRYLWNVAAVAPMYLFSIPWGGCFAVRRSAFDEARLAECWSESIVHDAPVKDRLNKLGLQVRFVPSLMMVLRETCSLSFSRDFLKRQMTWTRLYHPHWSPILLHAAMTTGLWFISAGLLIWGICFANPNVMRYTTWGLSIYVLTMVALIGLLEFSVRRVVHRRGESTGWMSAQTLLMLVPALPLTQVTYFVAVLEATFRRRVLWRGVTYLVHSPTNIELVSDRPFDQSTHAVESEMSL